jgi:hypothetical protein
VRSRGLGGGWLLACAFAFDPRGKMDDADRKPKRLGVLGGSGGGVSSDSVLPVLWVLVEPNARFMYFWRINLSMAPSASSVSTGIDGLLFWGL